MRLALTPRRRSRRRTPRAPSFAKIKSGHLKEQFGSREVWRPQWSLLTDRDTVHAALQLLVDYDWLSIGTVKTDGRSATVYTVNPKVLELLGP